jgi:hypothetical protein
MKQKQRRVKNDAPAGFSDKVWNKLSVPWRDAALTKTTEELEQEVIKAVRAIADTSAFMKDDKKLTVLQVELKNPKGSYTDTINTEKAKVDFCCFLFKDRGAKVKKNTQDAIDGVDDDDQEDVG